MSIFELFKLYNKIMKLNIHIIVSDIVNQLLFPVIGTDFLMLNLIIDKDYYI